MTYRSLFSSLCLLLAGLSSAAQPKAETEEWNGVKNSYKVSSELYRSGQPDAEGFRTIEAAGVKTILNLREYHKDDKKAAATNLKLLHYPVAAGEVTEDDLFRILSMMRQAPKPILVHCWHGSDRTGIVVAAYRIIEQNVSVEDAEKEFTEERFGHHEFWYGNLRKLLHSANWDELRRKLNATPQKSTS